MTVQIRRWIGILRMTGAEARADQISIVSSGVALRVALATFPATALLLWASVQLIGPGAAQAFLGAVHDLVPDSTQQVIRQAVTSSSAHGLADRGASNHVLGLAAPLVGFVFTMWSANSGMAALFDALNIIFDKTERRGYLRFLGLTLAFTVSTLVLMFVAIALVAAAPILVDQVGLPAQLQPWMKLIRWLVMVVVLALALAAFYRFGPNREGEHWPFLTIGSMLGAVLVALTSVLFSWLSSRVVSFSVTYGSLGGVAAYLLWLWALFGCVLICAELDACVENETGLYRTGSKPKRKSERRQDG